MRTYRVWVTELYADGHKWQGNLVVEATSPDVAVRRALRKLSPATGRLPGHGRLRNLMTECREVCD